MKLKEKLNKINKGKIKKTIKTFLSICLLTIIEVSICVFILQACQFNHNPNTFELIFMVGVPVMFIMSSLFYLFIRWGKLLYNKLVKGAK